MFISFSFFNFACFHFDCVVEGILSTSICDPSRKRLFKLLCFLCALIRLICNYRAEKNFPRTNEKKNQKRYGSLYDVQWYVSVLLCTCTCPPQTNRKKNYKPAPQHKKAQRRRWKKWVEGCQVSILCRSLPISSIYKYKKSEMMRTRQPQKKSWINSREK